MTLKDSTFSTPLENFEVHSFGAIDCQIDSNTFYQYFQRLKLLLYVTLNCHEVYDKNSDMQADLTARTVVEPYSIAVDANSMLF